MRLGLGRRSARQMAELDWSGTDDPSQWFESLVVFQIADRDVLDVR